MPTALEFIIRTASCLLVVLLLAFANKNTLKMRRHFNQLPDDVDAYRDRSPEMIRQYLAAGKLTIGLIAFIILLITIQFITQ